ncbi:hypothetical protein GCM10012275_43410 [Longimycelium tulufanense]|uniref:Uncharacterized protein n=1 Tax=Longimycelium tulufanense TaxID=907463 RepID=A0A8J3CHN6_9PSEU|nr:hypothetical protein [Longimycelium tulufanense]GGM68195.1 hypothetical protein GCM10012275_43410 [Longimycelium tulufanense]
MTTVLILIVVVALGLGLLAWWETSDDLDESPQPVVHTISSPTPSVDVEATDLIPKVGPVRPYVGSQW